MSVWPGDRQTLTTPAGQVWGEGALIVNNLNDNFKTISYHFGDASSETLAILECKILLLTHRAHPNADSESKP